jgi:hypothetical protein
MMASPMIAAKPASAPTVEMKWCTEKANGMVPMVSAAV